MLQTSPGFRVDWVSVVYESAPEKFHRARDTSLGNDGTRQPPCRGIRSCQSTHCQVFLLLVVPSFFLSASAVACGQTHSVGTATTLPNAPLPIIKHENSKSGPCRVIPKSESAGIALTETGSGFIATLAGFPHEEAQAEPPDSVKPDETMQPYELPPCQPVALINFYQRFMNGPEVKPLTPREKAHLAVKNVLDPFNAVTILGNAAITIGYNSHTAYGPGMHGFGKLVGVSYCGDITGEFVGTFLIPSIVHQDPHYHRMPHATIKRRILHAIVQVGWTQGDNGKGMPNYANIVGFPIDAEISNLYVPGAKTNLPSTATRVATGWALAPTDNFITEFLPDLARRIHVRVVLVQQIINQVAKTEPAGSP
jgi:hypothetical protein